MSDEEVEPQVTEEQELKEDEEKEEELEIGSDEEEAGKPVSKPITNREMNEQFESLVPMPIVHDLSHYLTLKGIISLTLAPFTQGLFHGLGEGVARVVVGFHWLKLDPYIALGGKLSAASPKKSRIIR